MAGNFSAYAQNEPEPQDESSESQEDPKIDRRQATELVQEKYSGRLISIRLVDSVWRARMDDEGIIYIVHVNAESGKVTRPDEE